MVGGVSPAWAARDAFFSAGLGFLLCVAYSALRLLFGASRVACAVSDVVIFVLGAAVYRSAALSRFYAGVPRWYTLLACAAAFFACRASLSPLLTRVRAVVLHSVEWPFLWLYTVCMCPLVRFCSKNIAQTRQYWRKKRKNRKKLAKKGLQNIGAVLYNSN